MASVCIRLEARDPAQGRFRAYRIEAGIDLLGKGDASRFTGFDRLRKRPRG